jgi:hypothetical protein
MLLLPRLTVDVIFHSSRPALHAAGATAQALISISSSIDL